MAVFGGRGFRPGNVVVAVLAICASWLLTGCLGGASTPLCDTAANLAEHGHLAKAAAGYATAEHAGEGNCAADGLSALADKRRQTFTDLAEAQAAEARGDRTSAHSRYGSVVAVDVDDAVAAAGLNRTAADTAAPSAAVARSATTAGTSKAAIATSPPAATGGNGESGNGTMLAACAFAAVAASMIARTRLRQRRARTRPRTPRLRKKLVPQRRSPPASSLFPASPPVRSDTGADSAETLQRLLDSSLRQQASFHEQRASLEQQRADLHQQRELLLRLLGERVSVVRFRGEHGEHLEYGERPATPPEAAVVDLRIVWVPTDDGGHGRLLMTRCIPPGTNVAQLARAYRPTGERGEPVVTPLPAFEEAVYDAIARQPVDVAWDDIELWWMTENVMSFAKAADVLAGPDGLHVAAHDLLVGRPIEGLLWAADARFPLPTAIAPMMAEADVASDVGIRSARTLLEVTGLVMGTAGGTPVVVSACTRSLPYDLMLSMVRDSTHLRAVPTPRRSDDAEPHVLDKGRVAAQYGAPSRAARAAAASPRADAVLEVVFGTGDPDDAEAGSDEAV